VYLIGRIYVQLQSNLLRSKHGMAFNVIAARLINNSVLDVTKVLFNKTKHIIQRDYFFDVSVFLNFHIIIQLSIQMLSVSLVYY